MNEGMNEFFFEVVSSFGKWKRREMNVKGNFHGRWELCSYCFNGRCLGFSWQMARGV